jgi:hypothetical protein
MRRTTLLSIPLASVVVIAAGATAQSTRSASPTVSPTVSRAASPTAPSVEQRRAGSGAPPTVAEAFNGLGVDFVGPQGSAVTRNPSDNSLAVGRDHIMQTVNSRLAIFTKRGSRYRASGTPLYGPMPTNTVFRGFGGACERRNSGDAGVRYDQLANRWLIVMPVFAREPRRTIEPPTPRSGEPAALSMIGREGQPGVAVVLYTPPADASTNVPPNTVAALPPQTVATPPRPSVPPDSGSYAMCYAISATSDPMGAYYRYEFVRPLFPDYPRPAVWPDGYYVPTSTSDDLIQRHACVVDRTRMLRGESATEQCVVIDGVNFLNNVDLDGPQLPPPGSPNILLATGGAQLNKQLADDGIYAWSFHVDWNDPTKTRLSESSKIAVAPYEYLCGGQLTSCVPQPGTDRKLDAQGDKLMARVVYRRIGTRESIVAVHSVNTSAGGGGVRWYEFRINSNDPTRHIALHQQGTYAIDSAFRWMASPAMDKRGNIGIGYSFGSVTQFAGQRFAARRATDPRGTLSRERILIDGGAAQTATLRWQDYTQTAIDPVDDCTIWYVGDYLRAGATSYSTRIGAFRMAGCRGTVR